MNNELGKIRKFTDLDAWKEGHQFVMAVYSITKKFPKEELFCLVSQMRRCAISITSNIAEGFSRQSFKEKLYFYSIALGSITELQNQLLIARDNNYISEKEHNDLEEKSIVVHKITNGLIKGCKTIIQDS